jgi:hypothetical protein
MPDNAREAISKNPNKSKGEVVLDEAFEPSTNKFWWYFSEKHTCDTFLILQSICQWIVTGMVRKRSSVDG